MARLKSTANQPVSDGSSPSPKIHAAGAPRQFGSADTSIDRHGSLPQTVRSSADRDYTLISLALFIHVFCVALTLSGNVSPSKLQERLISTVAPYTMTLNLDPNFTPFEMTSGLEQDQLHQIVVQFDDGQSLRFPDSGSLASFPFQRQARLARALAVYAEAEVDESTAAIALAVGSHVIRERSGGGTPGSASAASSTKPSAELVANRPGSGNRGADRRVTVRCHRVSTAAELATAENGQPPAAEIDNVLYEAEVWQADDGRFYVVKRTPPAESAPVVHD